MFVLEWMGACIIGKERYVWVYDGRGTCVGGGDMHVVGEGRMFV